MLYMTCAKLSDRGYQICPICCVVNNFKNLPFNNSSTKRFMLQMSFGAAPPVEHQNSCTQTEESCLCAVPDPPPPRYESPPPHPSSLPQNAAPNPRSNPNHGSVHRHGTRSSSAHNLENPPPPPPSTPVQYTVAVVESDPDKNSRQSSPSQNSKTESAHGEGGATKGAGLGGSMDYDQRSDYDNQPRDEEDMDVIMEQQLQQHHQEEEEEEEDSSSNGEEEQALFLKIRKPSAPKTNPTKRYSNGSSGSGRKSSWDEYGNMPPSHAMDHYAFNRYANDDDIIENRPQNRPHNRRRSSEKDNHHRHSHHRNQHYPSYSSGDGYVEGEMYDPDPDATIV